LSFIGWGSLLCAVTTLTVSYVLSPWTLATDGQLSTRSVVEGFSVLWTATMLMTAVRCLVLASFMSRNRSPILDGQGPLSAQRAAPRRCRVAEHTAQLQASVVYGTDLTRP
jgi:hypothetical protein